jgi:ABC-2 type transport system permease protein
MSVLRTLVGVGAAMTLAFLLYGFGIWRLGPVLVLYLAALMAMGWSVALAVTALILRHGAGAEALAWGVMFGIAPFAAVFYPVAVLPAWLQPVALAIPAAHVFEGMRAALLHGVVAWDHLAWAVLLNGVWLAGAAWIFLAQFQAARRRGALLNIGE